MSAGPTSYWCERAWLGGDRAQGRVLATVADGRFVSVEPGLVPPAGAVRLTGLTLPGFANAHSHAFHRALRGRTEEGRGTFWSWRESMYRVAGALSPSTYYALARAVYAEMALGGVTVVGEFHYLHHQPGGTPYADPNEMALALAAAALDAGLRVTLLDACYLGAGPGQGPDGAQLRFADAGAQAWASRTDALGPALARLGPGARAGAAIHSVRAVPPAAAGVVAARAAARHQPLHFHVSEQAAENEACLAAYARTPAQVLGDAGALGPSSTAVHATHLSGADVGLLGGSGTGVCMCPTTERDLADGTGPARRLGRAGSAVSLGTDSHAVVDMFEEVRALEMDERLVTGERGHWGAKELLASATAHGHEALGWAGDGRIAPGATADMVTVGLGSARLAGWDDEHLLAQVAYGATAADVTHVVAAGRPIVTGGCHQLVPDVPGALHDAIRAVLAP